MNRRPSGVERPEHDVRRELPAHVAAERAVDLPPDLGDLRVPAPGNELARARDDAVEVDEQVEREHRHDERAQDDRDVAQRPEEGLARGAEEVRKLGLQLVAQVSARARSSCAAA